MKQVCAVLLLVLGLAVAAPPAAITALPPRFASAGSVSGSVSSDKSLSSNGNDALAGATARAKAGGEWWVKDPPWFLPPPPEWGPMPPTMYTSYFHKPRYPALSTANYYPLYSRTDEYDAHLPASMSRRAAFTQQQIYDHYVATYRDHTQTMAGGAVNFAGDPNTGVSNPALYSSNFANAGALGEAHGRALGMQSPNNYFPLFHGAGSMMEVGARVYHTPESLAAAGDRFVTHFSAAAEPTFIEAESQEEEETDEADEAEEEEEEEEEEEAEADAESEADDEAEEAEDAEADE